MTGPGLSLHNLYYQTHGGPAMAARRRFGLAGLTLCLAASSCSPSSPPTPVGAPPGPTGSSAAPVPESAKPTVDAPNPPAPPPPGTPPVPGPLPLQAAEARAAGVATALAVGSTVPVEPASAFEVRIPLQLRDARLVLLDAQDLLVPAAVDSETGPAGSRFSLQPQEPLRPGSAYLLRLEGVGGRLVHSASDVAFEPLVLPVRVTGSPPPRPPPKKALKRRAG